MDPARWQRIKDILWEAETLPSHSRTAFLKRACAGDRALHRKVAELLEADEAWMAFLERPVLHFPREFREEETGALREIIGPYRLTRELGRGGMGTVYLAARIDGEYEHQVAVKVLKRGMDTDDILSRFRKERQILAKLNHPYIATLHEGGTTEDGLPYFVMEYVAGVPIDRYCDERKLSIVRRLELFRKVCSAVQYAHQKLVVHRDLKPGNILVGPDGNPKLLDFGIAKLLQPSLTSTVTATSLRTMTPLYASPEQVRGEPVTTSIDVYALGVLLYELLTGQRPYRLKYPAPEELQRVICEQEPEKPSTAVQKGVSVFSDSAEATTCAPELVSANRGCDPGQLTRRLSGDLDAMVLKALQKEPGRRYGSAEQFSEDIARHLRGFTVLAEKETGFYRLRKFVGRHRLAVTAVVLVFLLLLGSTLTVAWQQRQTARERDKAKRISNFLVDVFQASDVYHNASGDKVTARELLDVAANKMDGDLEEEPLVRAEMMHTIGWVYATLGLHDRARAQLEQALEIRIRNLGEEHRDVAETLSKLGYLFFDMGQYGEAEDLYRRAFAIFEKRLGSQHPEIAGLLEYFASLYGRQGKLEKAEFAAQKALAIRERNSETKPLELAGAMGILAGVFMDKGKRDEAVSLYERALELTQNALGGDHLYAAVILGNLALAYFEVGQYEKAEILYCRSLEINEKILGPEHPRATSALNNLALLYDSTGRPEEALPFYKRALEIREKILGPDNPLLAVILYNMAELFRSWGRLTEAEPYYWRALANLERAHPTGHPKLGRVLGGIGSLYRQMGNDREAERFMNEGLEISLAAHGPDHPDSAFLLYDLAKLYRKQKMFAEAEPLYEQALAFNDRQYGGSDHPALVVILHNLAMNQMAQGKYGESKPHLERALGMAERVFGRDHDHVALSYHLLAEWHRAQGEPDKALDYCTEALVIRERLFGQGHELVSQTSALRAEILGDMDASATVSNR